MHGVSFQSDRGSYLDKGLHHMVHERNETLEVEARMKVKVGVTLPVKFSARVTTRSRSFESLQ